MKPTRSFFIFLVTVLIVSGCASPQQATSVERDGSSIEKAVIVNSIREEYQWVQKHFPGARVTRQALIERRGKHYDELTFITPSGETRKVYFDINSFFGKL
jgi:uncharacterized protein YceK